MKTITAHIAKINGLQRNTDIEVIVHLTGEINDHGRAIGIVDDSSPVWAGKEVQVIFESLNSNKFPLINAND